MKNLKAANYTTFWSEAFFCYQNGLSVMVLENIYKIRNNLDISDLRVSSCYAEKFHKGSRIVKMRLR